MTWLTWPISTIIFGPSRWCFTALQSMGGPTYILLGALPKPIWFASKIHIKVLGLPPKLNYLIGSTPLNENTGSDTWFDPCETHLFSHDTLLPLMAISEFHFDQSDIHCRFVSLIQYTFEATVQSSDLNNFGPCSYPWIAFVTSHLAQKLAQNIEWFSEHQNSYQDNF